MTILSSLKTWLEAYSGLETDAPVWTNHLGSEPTQYGIVPLGGSRIIESYVDGSSLRSFPFAFQSVEYTIDELQRLQNIGFYELLADWFESETDDGALPTLGTGQTADSVSALGWGFLFEQGKSDTGIYQVQCQLVYEQAA